MQRERSHVKMLRDTRETIPGRRKQRLKRSIHKPRHQGVPAKLRKRQIPPESPWREPGPADTLIPTSSLQNCERIHFSCFSKASRSQCFVTSGAENTHWPSHLGHGSTLCPALPASALGPCLLLPLCPSCAHHCPRVGVLSTTAGAQACNTTPQATAGLTVTHE